MNKITIARILKVVGVTVALIAGMAIAAGDNSLREMLHSRHSQRILGMFSVGVVFYLIGESYELFRSPPTDD